MEPRGYDYGGVSGAGGKIRRRPPSRAAAASPYARPAPAPAPAAAAASQGGGWFSRVIAAGASRLLPSLFRKSPPQLTAPAPPPTLEPPSRDLLTEPRPEPLDAPPSPPPPPLEDDLPEGEENSGAIAYDDNRFTENAQSSAKEKEDMIRNYDDDHGMDLEELLKQRTFTRQVSGISFLDLGLERHGCRIVTCCMYCRSEFEYLTELLWSRTIGSSSLKPEDGNMRKLIVSEQENGSRHSNLPADFSITTYNVADQIASPAEIAKAYMGSKSSKGSPLRLRLHDPSSMPLKSMEASMTQTAKPPTIPLLQSSRLHTLKTSDRLESNYTTPNRSAIYKMSSSPYFKSGVSSKDLFSTVSSPYQTPSSVHTFGRQVLKRKSSAVNNEIVSVGPIRRMHQRYNRTSPLLETRPGYHRYLGGHGSKPDEGSEETTRKRQRRCLDKVGDATLGSLDGTAHANSFGQAPVQSAEMAAKILKQLDTLVPGQKENMSEIKQKHGNAMDVGNLISREKEVSAQSNHLGPSPSEVKESSLPTGSNGTAKATPAAVSEKIVDATSNRSDNEKPPTSSLKSNAPNLVLSSEINRNKMSMPSNGFSFPVPALGAHSQAPPTPTLASPPILPVEKQQPSVVFSASNTSMESHPRISGSIPEEGSIAPKFVNNLNADDKPMPFKNSGQGSSFTSNPVFKVVNSKPTSLSNGLGHMLNSTVSAIQPSNGSTNTASFQCVGSTSSTTAFKSTESSSTGGSSNFNNTGKDTSAASNMFACTTSQSVAAPSLASSGTGSPSDPFSFSQLFGTASSSAAQDKSKAVNSSTLYSFSQKSETASPSATQDKSKTVSSHTPFSSYQQLGIATYAAQDKSKAVGSSTCFGFSQQNGTSGSSIAQDVSKAASPEPAVLFGNQNGQSGNSNSLFTQNSANNLSFNSSEKSNNGSLQSFADSQVGSAPMASSPFNTGSVFPWATGSGSTSVAATVPPSSPATISAFGSSPASSASLMFGSKLTTPVPSSFGLPNTGPATSLFSPSPSAVFSFTSSTPSIPNPSPTTPFGGPTVQVNGGNMAADMNGSPFPTALPFGLQSCSPATPTFSTPATQFAPNTSSSPGIFGFGQQSQATSGGFSMGPGGGNDKSGRRIIRVKKRK
ncbi:hypothetical protein BAE44_0007756 [Dichanthelium oligosanthes]|uniref:Nuclear pore complex protein NUP1 n=1 Tax=Dichanthelium oligosanthes TaxID=888268 RepID=A0A1E5W1E3_9POAL|nr:hypothetical protein BAE44_0007756 [Dichanthelium oligosanthes]